MPVWYSGFGKPSQSSFKQCLADIQPLIIYLNGIFSYRFVIIPLLVTNKKKIKVVVCPRGMLQRGALAGKAMKKKIFLSALKISGLVKHVTWHATNEEEKDDIQRVFGKNSNVTIAKNIPKKPIASVQSPVKFAGRLRLVYLSLIAEKKNLKQIIELVAKATGNITLDIYGPVKDENYWKSCEQEINGSAGKIIYVGEVRPELVQETFAKYDASIILTKGENFGHALYESLSAGRPLITSHFTPWNSLEEKKAGWNLDISNDDSSLEKLQAIAGMDVDIFSQYCEGAYQLAMEYYRDASDIEGYKKMFDIEG